MKSKNINDIKELINNLKDIEAVNFYIMIHKKEFTKSALAGLSIILMNTIFIYYSNFNAESKEKINNILIELSKED